MGLGRQMGPREVLSQSTPVTANGPESGSCGGNSRHAQHSGDFPRDPLHGGKDTRPQRRMLPRSPPSWVCEYCSPTGPSATWEVGNLLNAGYVGVSAERSKPRHRDVSVALCRARRKHFDLQRSRKPSWAGLRPPLAAHVASEGPRPPTVPPKTPPEWGVRT